MSIKKGFGLVACTAALMLCSPAQASLITLTVTGTAGAATNLITGNPGVLGTAYLPVGTRVTWRALIDTSLNTDLDISQGGLFAAITSNSIQASSLNVVMASGTIGQSVAGAINTQNFQSDGVGQGLPGGLQYLSFDFTGQDLADAGSILSNANQLADDFESFREANTVTAHLTLFSSRAQEVVRLDNVQWQFTREPDAVPEPGTLALLSIAGGAWALRRRRMSSQPG